MNRTSLKERLEKTQLLAFALWAAIGCVILFVMAIQGLSLVGDALQLLFIGAIVGFMCSPITNWLEDKGVRRGIAAMLALVVFSVVVCIIGALILPSFVEQSIELAKRFPSFITQIEDSFQTFMHKWGTIPSLRAQDNIDSLVAGLSSMASKASLDLVNRLSQGLIVNLFAAVNQTVIFFLALVLAYWLAKDYPKIIRELSVIAGPSHEQDVVLLFAVLSRSMGGYMRGIVIMSVIDGLMSFVGFLIIDLPYAGLLGTIVAVFHFIPVVGPWISTILAMIVGLFVSPWLAIETLIVVMIVQNVTDNMISPVVMQSAVSVHPVLSLVAIAVGASLGGVVGMMLAVPLSAAIKGVFVYYFETKTGRRLVSENGALFRSRAYVDSDGKMLPVFDALDDSSFFNSSRLVGAHAEIARSNPQKISPETTCSMRPCKLDANDDTPGTSQE